MTLATSNSCSSFDPFVLCNAQLASQVSTDDLRCFLCGGEI
eukprot:COSAG01_NODE_52981_length_342_cov_1.061728_1_plen_40_part_01